MQTDEYCGDIYSCSLRLGPMKILKNYVVPIFIFSFSPSIYRKQRAPIVVDSVRFVEKSLIRNGTLKIV